MTFVEDGKKIATFSFFVSSSLSLFSIYIPFTLLGEKRGGGGHMAHKYLSEEEEGGDSTKVFRVHKFIQVKSLE